MVIIESDIIVLLYYYSSWLISKYTFITVKTQQQVLALDKENKQMKQTLQYLQQELIKSGKKNVSQNFAGKGGGGNPTPPSWQSPKREQRVQHGERSNTTKDNVSIAFQKMGRRKKW